MLRGTGLVLVVIWAVLLVFTQLLLRPVIGTILGDRLLQGIARHWFRNLQRVMGVRVHVSGAPAPGPVLIAANHISWMDIVVLGSHIGTCFVSKSEVATWPVLGWLARQGGTLFVHRGRHDSAERIAHDMTARLARAERLLFFPEGTTSDGSRVLRFRNRLFQAALAADAPVQPVALRYVDADDERNPVIYVEGVSLVASVIGVLAQRRTDVAVHWCPPFIVTGLERRDVAVMAEQQVALMHAAAQATLA